MKRIVVLGSGFAGMQAVVELERLFRRDANYEILLLSEQNFVLFTPLLPQIASSQVDPRHIAQAIRDVRGHRRFRFLRSTVSAIDLVNRRVETTVGPIAYDSLVIALGSRTNYFHTPGAPENTFDFKSLEDARRSPRARSRSLRTRRPRRGRRRTPPLAHRCRRRRRLHRC